MTCDHCSHCQDRARTVQQSANLFPLGTHLIHKLYGHVVYWRNDIDSSGGKGRAHYVYRADDADQNLFWVNGDDFELATLTVDLSPALVEFLGADAPELADLATEVRPYRGGLRLTLIYGRLHDLSRLVYWARDTAESASARRAAGRVAARIKEALGQ